MEETGAFPKKNALRTMISLEKKVGNFMFEGLQPSSEGWGFSIHARWWLQTMHIGIGFGAAAAAAAVARSSLGAWLCALSSPMSISSFVRSVFFAQRDCGALKAVSCLSGVAGYLLTTCVTRSYSFIFCCCCCCCPLMLLRFGLRLAIGYKTPFWGKGGQGYS